MAVRRQIDTDRRALSLVRLLYDIRLHPHVLTRARHLAHYDRANAKLATDEFDDIAGTGVDALERRHVQPDIDRLDGISPDLERFANRRVAHWDERAPEFAVTFHQLHAAIDVLESVVRRYRLIVLGRGGAIMPVFIGEWEAVFRNAWMPVNPFGSARRAPRTLPRHVVDPAVRRLRAVVGVVAPGRKVPLLDQGVARRPLGGRTRRGAVARWAAHALARTATMTSTTSPPTTLSTTPRERSRCPRPVSVTCPSGSSPSASR